MIFNAGPVISNHRISLFILGHFNENFKSPEVVYIEPQVCCSCLKKYSPEDETRFVKNAQENSPF